MKRDKVTMRQNRAQRVRNKVQGTVERPRMSVFRSNKFIYVQVIDDEAQTTIVSASSLEKELKQKINEFKAMPKAVPAEAPKAEEPAKKGKEKEKKVVEKPKTASMFSSELVGAAIAERCKAKGISRVVFDRSGYKYHGRVKQLAESARKAGLDF